MLCFIFAFILSSYFFFFFLFLFLCFFFFFFFFSSRRRHTRLTCDWSSDVCSSDLEPFPVLREIERLHAHAPPVERDGFESSGGRGHGEHDSAAPRGVRKRACPKIGRASCRERV